MYNKIRDKLFDNENIVLIMDNLKNSNETKKTWETIKSILHIKKSKKESPPFFKIENLEVSNKYEIAECFS